MKEQEFNNNNANKYVNISNYIIDNKRNNCKTERNRDFQKDF